MLRHVIEDGLWLELLRPHHAETLFAAIDANRDHLRGWLPWVDGTRSVKDTLAFIEGSLRKLAENRSLEQGIWRGGELVGVIGFRGLSDSNRQAEIGYWLTEEAEGAGIMTKVCRAMIDYGFGELGLNRVKILCGTGNGRSQGVPERLGFVREGVAREAEKLPGGFTDLVIYGLLARDWPTPADGSP